jgi:hypothetical protein
MTTLREAFSATRDSRDFGFRLRHFLDDFYAEPTAAAFEAEPESLATQLEDQGLADTYLAALAEHLCRCYHLPVPGWSRANWRILKHPFFAMQTPRARAFLLQDSPAAFRARNIFINRDALSRV